MANAQIIEGTTEEEDLSLGLPTPPNTIRDVAHLEALLLEGLQSGPSTPMMQSDWDDIRREVRERARK